MKKMLLMAVTAMMCAFGFGAERLAVVRTGDMNTLVKTATKSGELVGYPMLGAMAAMSMAANPLAEYFGQMRDGEGVYGVLYFTRGADNQIDFASLQYAVIYPVATTRESFIASHPKCEDKDGVIAVPEDTDDDEEEPAANVAKTYTVFSEDGLWATMSDNREAAIEAVKEVGAYREPMGGDALRVYLSAEGVAALNGTFLALADQISQQQPRVASSVELFRKLIDSFESGVFSVAVSDMGLDIKTTANLKSGSFLNSFYRETLGDNMFSFASNDAYLLSANAANSAFQKDWAGLAKIVALLADNGVKLPFIARSGEDPVQVWTIDIAEAVKFANDENTFASLVALDTPAVREALDKISTETYIKEGETSPAGSIAFALAGRPLRIAPQERWNKAMSDWKDKKACLASISSIYAFVKALVPEFLQFVPESEQSMVKTVLATLPGDEDGAVCTLAWRDSENSVSSVLRVSTPEIRSYSAVANAVIAYMAMCGEQCVCEPVADDDDDGDDD